SSFSTPSSTGSNRQFPAIENDKKEDKEPISHEENKISAEDFEKIDTAYAEKKGPLSKLFKKSESSEDNKTGIPATGKLSDPKTKESDVSVLSKRMDDCSFNIDKLNGRLEAETGFREAMNERLTSFAEEIGELRSMILDREKSFNDIQVGFERIDDATRNIQPAKIHAEFEKKEKMIIDNTIKVEKIELFVNSINDEMKKYRMQMNKIKSFDNLLEAIDTIKIQIDQIKDSKNYVDVKTAKVESIFADLNERLKDFNKAQETIAKLDELTQELMKTIDKNEIKIEEAALKEDLNKKVAPIENYLVKSSKKINELSDNILKIHSKIDVLDVREIETIKKEIVGIEKVLGSLEERISKSKKLDMPQKIIQIENEYLTVNKEIRTVKSLMDGIKKEVNSFYPANKMPLVTTVTNNSHLKENISSPHKLPENPQKFSEPEKEIIKQIGLAKGALDEYNITRAKKYYQIIRTLLNPLATNHMSENRKKLFEASAELYRVLTIPGTHTNKFKQLTTELI
ncbi:MAG: hypothetical protein KAT91_02745, partial [Candidatus Aenigmarchaeota archaeon]|nr:hypothetical protein [Candidatus Aenigmarchaeota archaeon]